MNRMSQCLALAAGAMVGAAGAVASIGWDQPEPGRDPTLPPTTNPDRQPGQPQPGSPDRPDRPGTLPDRQPGQPTSPTNPGRLPPSNPDRQPGMPRPDQPGINPAERPGLTGLTGEKIPRDKVDLIIASWPQEAKQAAQDTLGKYGQPDGYSSKELIWHSAGPWQKVVVTAMEVQHNFPIAHKDCVMGFINMKVPVDKVGDLAKFDGSICYERTGGIVGAMCDKEEMNFAVLNIAHDIVTGSKSVEEARDQLAKVAMAFKQGTKDPITQGFQFNVEKGMTGDPDQPGRGGPGSPDLTRPGTDKDRIPGLGNPGSPDKPDRKPGGGGGGGGGG
jgi:hypothetical protein